MENGCHEVSDSMWQRHLDLLKMSSADMSLYIQSIADRTECDECGDSAWKRHLDLLKMSSGEISMYIQSIADINEYDDRDDYAWKRHLELLNTKTDERTSSSQPVVVKEEKQQAKPVPQPVNSCNFDRNDQNLHKKRSDDCDETDDPMWKLHLDLLKITTAGTSSCEKSTANKLGKGELRAKRTDWDKASDIMWKRHLESVKTYAVAGGANVTSSYSKPFAVEVKVLQTNPQSQSINSSNVRDLQKASSADYVETTDSLWNRHLNLLKLKKNSGPCRFMESIAEEPEET